ncbi:MAG: integrase domain-containing protein [Burkholderiaceae bacterium]|nr:integrase domain-containing protein [Burkholderiaceae bacterium]MBX9937148.1 integrase domain-containing protein [Burkholderiaceae bacterium]
MGIAIAEFSAAFVADKKGGFGTRQRAGATWRALNKFVEAKRWKDINPTTLTTKQIRAFVEHRLEQGVSARSIQNEVSHIRRACVGVGRDIGDLKDVKNNWSGTRLAVPVGSRIGGKRAIDPERLALALAQVPPDVAVALRLSEALGLRRQEAVMAGQELREWGRLLEQAQQAGHGVFLPVRCGTKGGRPRHLLVPLERLAAVQAVVQQAQGQAAQQQGRVIAAEDLKKALKRVSNACTRAGLVREDSNHGIRRLFAHKQVVYYLQSGLSREEALARLSNDLGHGDGRGRWVENNYLRGGEV